MVVNVCGVVNSSSGVPCRAIDCYSGDWLLIQSIEIIIEIQQQSHDNYYHLNALIQ